MFTQAMTTKFRSPGARLSPDITHRCSLRHDVPCLLLRWTYTWKHRLQATASLQTDSSDNSRTLPNLVQTSLTHRPPGFERVCCIVSTTACPDNKSDRISSLQTLKAAIAQLAYRHFLHKGLELCCSLKHAQQRSVRCFHTIWLNYMCADYAAILRDKHVFVVRAKYSMRKPYCAVASATTVHVNSTDCIRSAQIRCS